MSDTELTFRDLKDYISKYQRVLDFFDAVNIKLKSDRDLIRLAIVNTESHSRLQSMTPKLRQGDVLIIPSDRASLGRKLSHLTLAEGEVTGHSHRISNGEAELFERSGVLYLKVLSPTAILTHEEHAQITIPQGNWEIRIQREYTPDEGWRNVCD